MSTITRAQFDAYVQSSSASSNTTVNIFSGSNVTYSNDVNTAEQQIITVNPTPFEAYTVPSAEEGVFTPTVISAMESTEITSVDVQRDPIYAAVVNDLVGLANLMNSKGDAELLLLEKVNMILHYLQASIKTTTFATKVVHETTDDNERHSLLYTGFATGDTSAIEGIVIDPKKKDKGGFRFFNNGALDGEGAEIAAPRPVFTLMKRSNYRISESFQDYASIFLRVKNTTYVEGLTDPTCAPVIVLKFFSKVSNDLLFKVYLTLSSAQFTTYNDANTVPTLIAWGADPRDYSFTSPRSYDNLILLTQDNVSKIEDANGNILEINDAGSENYVSKDELFNSTNGKFKSLVVKEITMEFDSANDKTTSPINLTLFSFGNIISGGLPQEYVCYMN